MSVFHGMYPGTIVTQEGLDGGLRKATKRNVLAIAVREIGDKHFANVHRFSAMLPSHLEDAVTSWIAEPHNKTISEVYIFGGQRAGRRRPPRSVFSHLGTNPDRRYGRQSSAGGVSGRWVVLLVRLWVWVVLPVRHCVEVVMGPVMTAPAMVALSKASLAQVPMVMENAAMTLRPWIKFRMTRG